MASRWHDGARLRWRPLLRFTLGPTIVTIVLGVLLTQVSVDLLSAVRAAIEGESLWSKGEKAAVLALDRYADTGDAQAYADYLAAIAIPLGDRDARRAIEAAHYDAVAARAGLAAGGNHRDDIPGMLRLFRHFDAIDAVARAKRLWSEGDAAIADIVDAAQALHALIGAPSDTPGWRRDVEAARTRIHAADERVTPLANAFSATLGDGAREVRAWLQLASLLLAVTLLIIAVVAAVLTLHKYSFIKRELRASEMHFDLAVRGSNDGIWHWDAEGDHVYLSPRCSELLGIATRDAAPTLTDLMQQVHRDDRDAVRAALRALRLRESSLDVEFRVVDARGASRWVQLRGGAFDDPGHGIAGAAGALADIDARRSAAERERARVAAEHERIEQAQVDLLEQVHRRVARELHDDLGQRLTGVAFLMKALEGRLAAHAPTECEHAAWIVRMTNDVIERVRFLSHQLGAVPGAEVSLDAALKKLVEDTHHIFGTHITLDAHGDATRLPPLHAAHLFRIAQESISNALRHGGASAVALHLDVQGDVARLAVTDNGQGFDPRAVDRSASLGLRSMATRARAMQGRLRLRSGPRGTLVIVRSQGASRDAHAASPAFTEAAA